MNNSLGKKDNGIYRTGDVILVNSALGSPGAGWMSINSGAQVTDKSNLAKTLKASFYNWSPQIGAISTTINSVAYGNGVWVVGGGVSTSALQTSTNNAVTWNTQTSGFGTVINSIEYGNGIFVAGCGSAGGQGILATSSNGTSWTTRAANFQSSINAVAFGNGVWVGGGFGYSTQAANIRTSTNGLAWHTQTSNFSTGQTVNSIAYGNGLWIASAPVGGIRTSTNDGVTWTTSTAIIGNRFAYGNGVWVAGGSAGVLRTSTNDAVTWTTQGTSFSVDSIVYADGVFTVTAGTSVYTSADGVNWAEYSNAFTTVMKSIRYGNGIWVAGGNAGSINRYIKNILPIVASTTIGGYTWWIKT